MVGHGLLPLCLAKEQQRGYDLGSVLEIVPSSSEVEAGPGFRSSPRSHSGPAGSAASVGVVGLYKPRRDVDRDAGAALRALTALVVGISRFSHTRVVSGAGMIPSDGR
jgi:hypothetical protein